MSRVLLLAFCSCVGTASSVASLAVPAPAGDDAGVEPAAALLQCQAPEAAVSLLGVLGEEIGPRSLPTDDPEYDQARPLDFKTYNDNKSFSLINELAYLAGGDHLWLDGAGLSMYGGCQTGQSLGYSCELWERHELQWSAIGVHVLYTLAWKSCQQVLAKTTDADKQADWLELKDKTVTPDTARRFCRRHAAWAWNREASPEELDACVELALDVAANGENAKPIDAWAHVCASIVVSANALTY